MTIERCPLCETVEKRPATMEIRCQCGTTAPFCVHRVEVGQDTYVSRRSCNGISCDYYECPGGDECYAGLKGIALVNVSKILLRFTCRGCERVTEMTEYVDGETVGREPIND